MKRLAVALLLASCVPSQHELRAPVEAVIHRERVDVAALLARPLDHESAVAIALANSPRLAAALDELGIAGGELAEALGIGPTQVDVYLRMDRGHEYEFDVVQSVLGLVTMPRRRAAAHADLAAARAEATATALRIAGRVRIAFGNLLAAQQEAELRRTAFDAADAAATVRERMHAAGNTTDLAQARDRDAREQTRIDLARAEAEVERRREAVNALLGLTGDRTRWLATGTLAELPAAAPALDDLEHAAVAANMDLTSGRAHVEAAANRAGATRITAVLPELALGVSAMDIDGDLQIGPALRIGLPLFDQRAGARARAEAELARRQHELEATAVELRADARAVRITALEAYDEARHLHDVVLPLRQQIVDEMLLHYNAMDADPFQLIVARKGLAEAGHEYLDALRRYWGAMAEVEALRAGVALGGTYVDQP
jgi:outer membrane protein TolC